MSIKSGTRPTAVLLAFGLLAFATGVVVNLVDPLWAIAGMAGAIAVGVVLFDYRAGAVCLTFLLPWYSSPLLPQRYGFNLINFLIAASVVSLGIRHLFSREPVVPIPRFVRWCYLIPIAIAALVALPHLAEGAANFPARGATNYQVFAFDEYIKTIVIKPMFFVIYAFVLGNAIRDSKKPERFLLAFGCSATLAALAVIMSAITSLGAVEQRDTYLEQLGMHPNSYGTLLAFASGPLLFLAAGSGSKLSRTASALAFGIVSLGVLFTGSRGAALAYIVVLLVWLLRRKKFSDIIVAAMLASLLAFAIPENVWDRLTLGIDDTQATTVSNTNDPLTKGRLASWTMLAPDILLSPVWGQGISSVAWNKATSAGRYGALLSHNTYLDILLDLGIAGFVALLYVYYNYARGFRLLSRASSLSPVLRDYFTGAFASFLGMLMMAFTNGYYMPHPEQSFLWFGLAMLFAHWNIVLGTESESDRSVSMIDRGMT